MAQRLAAGAVCLALAVLVRAPLGAQIPLPQVLAPPSPNSDVVSPFFEGWYENPDGTYTLSFGYFSRNMKEPVVVPVGPDNFIEPAEFDGSQTTHFLPTRERGSFAVTIPGSMKDTDVVWTIHSGGQTHRVPGRTVAPGYRLSHTPQAAGSVPPALRFERDGPAGRGPGGITAPAPLAARVGVPLPLTVWLADDLSVREEAVPMGATWVVHQSPADGAATFEPERAEADAEGKATATATFSAPGDYVLRVRGDSFFVATDSRPDNQCCWTNGFVRVRVEP